jgi:hypothetical protein
MTAFLISILLSIKFEGGLHKSKVPIRIGFENDIEIEMKTELPLNEVKLLPTR